MHISQFEREDLIRHSSYKRGEFAQVGVKGDDYVVILTSDGITITVESPQDQWEDGEWAHLTPDWIPDDDLRETLFPG